MATQGIQLLAWKAQPSSCSKKAGVSVCFPFFDYRPFQTILCLGVAVRGFEFGVVVWKCNGKLRNHSPTFLYPADVAKAKPKPPGVRSISIFLVSGPEQYQPTKRVPILVSHGHLTHKQQVPTYLFLRFPWKNPLTNKAKRANALFPHRT